MSRQRGFSLVDLIVTMAIIATLAAVVTPSLLRARLQANDAAAVVNLKSVQTAQNIYALAYPQQGYADTLSKLGDPPAGQAPSAAAAGLLPPTIACPTQPCTHDGFMYEIYRASGQPVQLYWIRARPVTPGKTGLGTYRSMNDDKIALESTGSERLSDAPDEGHQ